MPNELLEFKSQLKRFRTYHRWRRDPTNHVRSDIEERSGTVGNDNACSTALIVEQGCRYSNIPQNTWVTIGLDNFSFTMRNTITEDKLTNTFAVGDKMAGDAPTARTGLALCHRVILDSVAHWVPARTRTVHQCLHGGKPWVARDTLHHTTKTTRPRFTASRFGYQHGCGSGLLKPQIYEMTTRDRQCDWWIEEMIANPLQLVILIFRKMRDQGKDHSTKNCKRNWNGWVKIGWLISRNFLLVHHLHKICGQHEHEHQGWQYRHWQDHDWSEDLHRSWKQSAQVPSEDQQDYQWKDREWWFRRFF